MNTKLLRQKVLDLAIHGKLVPQNPEHEPASKLLERIRGESLPLATAGNPSSAAPSAGSNAVRNAHSNPISEDEIPFEIPENWCWCRFSDYTINRDSERKPVASKNRKEVKKIYDYYGATGVVDKIDDYLFDDTLLLISEDGANLLSRSKNNAFIASGKFWVNNHAHVIDCYYKESLKYLASYINSLLLDEYVTGSAQPKLTQNALNNMYLPLPPLEEQKLIVEEIERIFALIDTLEQNKADLETVIKQTKSKILDLAIHGKLVPQDKTYEPASKMLEKLRAEKEEKIANGQLKRDKNDSYIYKSADGKWLERKADGSEEEIEVPFEIPESWSWCRLSEISTLKGGKRIPAGLSATEEKTSHIYIRVTDMKNDTISTEDLRYISDFIYEQIKQYTIGKNDLYLTIAGTIGRVGEVPDVFDNMNLTENALKITNMCSFRKYLMYVIKSTYVQEYFDSTFHQVAMPKLSLTNAAKTLIALPPIEEQKLIVAKIEEIFTYLDSITKSIG